MKKDLTQKTSAELHSLLLEKAKSFRDLKLGLSKTKTKNLKEGKNIRKEIARILTLVHASENKKA
jgi:ribosomal protein L29